MSFRRSLEEAAAEEYYENENGEMRFGKCVYIKIPENNNDDGAEGNSYFYNGRYYAQHQAMVSYSYCVAGGDGGNTCPAYCLAPEKYYVTDIQTFLEPRIEYLQNYCQACQNQCRRRRRLEDQQAEDDVEVDCNSCGTTCQYVNDGNNNGVDESNYMDCQAAYVNEDGKQLYSAPGCNNDGRIVIALYHNDECTVKSSTEYSEAGFGYSYFTSVQDLCVDCQQAEGVCDIEDSTICDSDGNTLQGDDDGMKICSKFYQATKEYTYGKRKKKLYWEGYVILGFLLMTCICTASYTYFIRHRKSPAAKAPLSSADGQTSTPSATTAGGTLA